MDRRRYTGGRLNAEKTVIEKCCEGVRAPPTPQKSENWNRVIWHSMRKYSVCTMNETRKEYTNFVGKPFLRYAFKNVRHLKWFEYFWIAEYFKLKCLGQVFKGLSLVSIKYGIWFRLCYKQLTSDIYDMEKRTFNFHAAREHPEGFMRR